MHIYVYSCIFIRIYTHKYIYTHTHKYTHTHTHTDTWMGAQDTTSAGRATSIWIARNITRKLSLLLVSICFFQLYMYVHLYIFV